MPISTSVYLTWNWHKVWYACFGVRITLFQAAFRPGELQLQLLFRVVPSFPRPRHLMPSPPLSVPPVLRIVGPYT